MSEVGVLALTLACGVFISAQSAEHKRPPASSVSDVGLSSAIKLVRPSIVQIGRRFEISPAEREALHLQSDSLALGTGFIVDVKNGYVVTALHVAGSGEQPMVLPNGQPWHPQRDDLRIEIPMPNIKLNSMTFQESFVGVGYTVVARDERHDLALLKATGQIENIFYIKTRTQDIRVHPKAGILYLGAINDGDAIAVSGYPLNSNVLITTSGAIASSDAINIKEVQLASAPAGFTRPDTADSYIADVKVNPGDSGGPMYLVKNGAVIGVCLNFQGAPVMTIINGEQRPVTGPNGEPVMYNSGLGVFVPAKYVADLLKQNGVKFQSTN